MTPIEIATCVTAYSLALARLLGAARPLYGWLPEKAQPVVPALLAVLPAIANQARLRRSRRHSSRRTRNGHPWLRCTGSS
jgi:hypothetical protein